MAFWSRQHCLLGYSTQLLYCFAFSTVSQILGFSMGCWHQTHPKRGPLEEPVWMTRSRAYDEGFSAKEKINMNVCIQETRKRKKTIFSSKITMGAWRFDSFGQSNYYSCRIPVHEFSSQHTWVTSHPSLTGDPGD